MIGPERLIREATRGGWLRRRRRRRAQDWLAYQIGQSFTPMSSLLAEIQALDWYDGYEDATPPRDVWPVEAWERLADSLPQPVIDRLCADALRPDTPGPELTEFCRSHGFAPTDKARRAVFLYATGQKSELAALDPDGALLAAGYATVSSAEHHALRRAGYRP